jgi:probable F420-dependent oxidoreductase
MKWEFDHAEILWEPFGARVEQLRATIERLRAEFASDGFPQQAPLRDEFGIPTLAPVQRSGFDGHGPPLIVGGTGDRVLRLAGEYADIISVAGAFQLKGLPPGTMRVASDVEADERMSYARECAGERAADVEWHALIQVVVPSDNREAAASALAARFGNVMSAEEILGTPFVLIGTVEQMADQVLRNRDRYGFTRYTVHGPFMTAFAPVVERLRART